ncbi:hypothetical protein [Roseateles sp. LYH14W]|uniref:Peptidase S9 prolyl oligopeptidase catalytic domain-containing protein n=1 Tax=Pelomonas parva TaxID=3299032 RepID=A0ABW7F8M7_9BURK
MRFYFFATLLALLASAVAPVAAAGAAGPSVRDVVEFKKIVQPLANDAEALRRQTSPDGRRAFVVTRKADVASDCNRYEIVMLDLEPQRLAQGRPSATEVVFSFDAKFDEDSGYPALAEVQWAGDQTLVFRAKIHDEIFQVYSLNLSTRQVAQLTHSPMPIWSFAASGDLKRLVYVALVSNPPLKDGARSIVVGNQWARGVLYGQEPLKNQISKFRFYVEDVGTGPSPRPLGEPFFLTNAGLPMANISPDGRWAILPKYEPSRGPAWRQQYPLLDEITGVHGPAMKIDPLGYFTGSTAFTARRMVAWRLDDGHVQTIVDAPDDALPGGGQSRRDKAWLGTGSSIVLAGTHLPLVADQTSTASHVIEYWPDSGRWIVVAKLNGRLKSAVSVGDRLEVEDGTKTRQFQRAEGGGWREVAPVALVAKSKWSLEVQQALNEPPDVVATGPAGQVVRLTNFNPQFDAKTWGAVSTYRWLDAKGRSWEGGLLPPLDASPGKRLPLVIQAYLYRPNAFYLDGPNSRSQGYTSAYPGRAFVREGVLVLAMRYWPLNGSNENSAEENRIFNEGVKGAVDALVREGRVDPDRVGIIGFSATGAKVMNLITFSGLPMRAATIADGDSDTLFSYAITYASSDYTWWHKEMINGGIPVRPTLSSWMANDPALNTDCIGSALRIETYGRAISNYWDIYALMRRQYKPADLILIPSGTHGLSTPSERMISLQGNVDWFNFWLQGEKRDEPFLVAETQASLRAQYEAWDQMAVLKQADDGRPRCPLKSAG